MKRRPKAVLIIWAAALLLALPALPEESPGVSGKMCEYSAEVRP
jgi:hypothetical protein